MATLGSKPATPRPTGLSIRRIASLFEVLSNRLVEERRRMLHVTFTTTQDSKHHRGRQRSLFVLATPLPAEVFLYPGILLVGTHGLRPGKARSARRGFPYAMRGPADRPRAPYREVGPGRPVLGFGAGTEGVHGPYGFVANGRNADAHTDDRGPGVGLEERGKPATAR